jgi:hypothetical protein
MVGLEFHDPADDFVQPDHREPSRSTHQHFDHAKDAVA